MSNSENHELLNGVSHAAFKEARADETANTARDIPHPPLRSAYPLPEAAVKLGGVSQASLYRWRAKGLIRFIKIGGRTLVPASEISRLAGQSVA